MNQRQPSTAVVLVALFLVPVALCSLPVALPAIAKDLPGSQVSIQWAINSFNIALAATIVFAGALADRRGPRPVLVCGLIVLAAAAALGACSPGVVTLGISRALAGGGSALVVVSGSVMLSLSSPAGRPHSRSFAALGTTVGVSLALGPGLVGLCAEILGWRAAFLLISVGAAVASWWARTLPSRDELRPARRARRGIAGSELLKPHFMALCLVPVAAAVGYMTVLTYLPVALSATLGLSPAETGGVALSMTLPVLGAPLLAARIVGSARRVSTQHIVSVSFLALALGNAALLLLEPRSSVVWWMIPLALLGLGYGLSLGLIDFAAIRALPESSSGLAAGMINFIRAGSAAAAVACFGAAIARNLASAVPHEVAGRAMSGEQVAPGQYLEAIQAAIALMLALLAIVAAMQLTLSRMT